MWLPIFNDSGSNTVCVAASYSVLYLETESMQCALLPMHHSVKNLELCTVFYSSIVCSVFRNWDCIVCAVSPRIYSIKTGISVVLILINSSCYVKTKRMKCTYILLYIKKGISLIRYFQITIKFLFIFFHTSVGMASGLRILYNVLFLFKDGRKNLHVSLLLVSTRCMSLIWLSTNMSQSASSWWLRRKPSSHTSSSTPCTPSSSWGTTTALWPAWSCLLTCAKSPR